MNTYRLTTFVLAGLLLFLAACSAPPAGQPLATEAAAVATMGAPMVATAGAAISADQQFIDMMVPHHESAVAMAQVALERSQHADIRRIAENIIAAQQAEIALLRTWRGEWFGSSETPPMSAMPMLTEMEGMPMEPMDMQAEVEKLRQAAEPFDVAFIEMMVEHHQQAIDAAQWVLTRTEHTEIETMAQQIIADQQREITELQSLLAAISGFAVTPTP